MRAAERYASVVVAARTIDSDFLAAAVMAARHRPEDALALAALRYLAGDTHGVRAIMEHLANQLMRAGFRKKLRPVSRAEAMILAGGTLVTWASTSDVSQAQNATAVAGRDRMPHVAYLFGHLDRIVAALHRHVTATMGGATA